MTLQGEGDYEVAGEAEGSEVEPYGNFEYFECFEG
jgi:hypothetical protein